MKNKINTFLLTVLFLSISALAYTQVTQSAPSHAIDRGTLLPPEEVATIKHHDRAHIKSAGDSLPYITDKQLVIRGNYNGVSGVWLVDAKGNVKTSSKPRDYFNSDIPSLKDEGKIWYYDWYPKGIRYPNGTMFVNSIYEGDPEYRLLGTPNWNTKHGTRLEAYNGYIRLGWSQDGKSTYLYSAQEGLETWPYTLYEMALDLSWYREIITFPLEIKSSLLISPDSRLIAYTVDDNDDPEDRQAQLYLFDVETETSQIVAGMVGDPIGWITSYKYPDPPGYIPESNPWHSNKSQNDVLGLLLPKNGNLTVTRLGVDQQIDWFPNKASNCNEVGGHSYCATDFADGSNDHGFMLGMFDQFKIDAVKWSSPSGQFIRGHYPANVPLAQAEWIFQILHHSAVYIEPGNILSLGQIYGREGHTGRSTGEHIHLDWYHGNTTDASNRQYSTFIESPWHMEANHPGCPCDDVTYLSHQNQVLGYEEHLPDNASMIQLVLSQNSPSASFSNHQNNQSESASNTTYSRLTSYGEYGAGKFYSGPEKYYKVIIDQPGTIEVSITDIKGVIDVTAPHFYGNEDVEFNDTMEPWEVDLDVFVLSGTNPISQVIGSRSNDGNTVSAEVLPGIYYVSIDGIQKYYSGGNNTWGGNVGKYDIVFSFTLDWNQIPCEVDLNGTPSQAGNITGIGNSVSGNKTVLGCIKNIPIADIDWYQVFVTERGNLDVGLQSEVGQSLSFRLYGTIPYTNIPVAISPVITGPIDGTIAHFPKCCESIFGCWYSSVLIKVYKIQSIQGQKIPYTLDLSWQPDSSCDPGFGPDVGTESRSSLIVMGPATVCAGTTTDFSASGGSPPYDWEMGGTFLGTTTDDQPIPVGFSVGGILKVTDSDCNQSDFVVSVVPGISYLYVTANPLQSPAAGYPINLTASTPTQALFNWSDGGFGYSRTVYPITTTTYTVTATSTSGCTMSGSTTVSVGTALSPTNDEPCDAIELPVASSCVNTLASNIGATVSPNFPVGCDGPPAPDVWYRVVVPESGKAVITTSPGSLIDCGMTVYRGTCSNLQLLGCFPGGSPSDPNHWMPYAYLTGLQPGETLFIRLWEYNGNQFGVWNLCAVDPSPVTQPNGSPPSGDYADIVFQELAVNPQQVLPGASVELSGILENIGDQDYPGGGQVVAYLSSDLHISSGDEVLHDWYLSDMDEGDDDELYSYFVTAPPNIGTYWVLFRIEPTEDEYSGNNVQPVPLVVGQFTNSLPDLRVDLDAIQPVFPAGTYPGALVSTNVVVWNEGSVSVSENVWVHILAQPTPGDLDGYYVTVDSFQVSKHYLDPDDGEHVVHREFIIPNLVYDYSPPHNVRFHCFIDLGDDITEADEWNNTDARSITLTDPNPQLPDFESWQLTAWNGLDQVNLDSVVGGISNVQWRIHNWGTGYSNQQVRSRVYVSEDPILNLDQDYQIAYDVRAAPGPQSTIATGEAINSTYLGRFPDVGYLIINTNTGNGASIPPVVESDFGDNVSVFPYRWITDSIADLSVRILQVYPTVLTTTDTVTVTVQVGNRGTAASDTTLLRAWLGQLHVQAWSPLASSVGEVTVLPIEPGDSTVITLHTRLGYPTPPTAGNWLLHVGVNPFRSFREPFFMNNTDTVTVVLDTLVCYADALWQDYGDTIFVPWNGDVYVLRAMSPNQSCVLPEPDGLGGDWNDWKYIAHHTATNYTSFVRVSQNPGYVPRIRYVASGGPFSHAIVMVQAGKPCLDSLSPIVYGMVTSFPDIPHCGNTMQWSITGNSSEVPVIWKSQHQGVIGVGDSVVYTVTGTDTLYVSYQYCDTTEFVIPIAPVVCDFPVLSLTIPGGCADERTRVVLFNENGGSVYDFIGLVDTLYLQPDESQSLLLWDSVSQSIMEYWVHGVVPDTVGCFTQEGTYDRGSESRDPVASKIECDISFDGTRAIAPQGALILITDMLGRVLSRTTQTMEYILSLPQGLYIISVKTEACQDVRLVWKN